MRNTIIIGMCLLYGSVVAGQECSDLFDGQSLAGWTVIGEQEYFVSDGAITGRARHGIPSSYLRTNDTFADFDLTLEFNVDAGFNAGVQFRSAQAGETLRWDHQAGDGRQFTMETKPGAVYGYQAEIDPSDRAWTAEIYEQGARGWLQTFDKEPAGRRIEPGNWHRMRIRAEGDEISTWLDGEPVAALTDANRAEGFIALQVHSVPEPEDTGKSVRFRDLRLCSP